MFRTTGWQSGIPWEFWYSGYIQVISETIIFSIYLAFVIPPPPPEYSYIRIFMLQGQGIDIMQ